MILDHAEHLAVDDVESAISQNSLQTLRYLWSGLSFLNQQVSAIEKELGEKLNPNKNVMFIIGNSPLLADVPQGLIACAFHWYATSACNFVRLIGWLGNERSPKRADAYVGRVIPEVRVWRNKVAAHFAITDPRAEDTAAVLQSSVMFPIGYSDGVFVTQPLTLSMTQAGVPTRTRSDMTWSLTKVHLQLMTRYTGEGVIPNSY